ncbi:MAG: hypothetical protein M3Y86_02800 [Verrucomicrobiota bacterium]|nr:hypothetical protein [Verrucomicrobiota bacterium]
MISQLASRLLVALLFCALVGMFAPAKARAVVPVKASCCAHMPVKPDPANDCPMHHQAPAKPQPDSTCCQACAAGLALLFSAPAAFVYGQTGEQLLVSLDVGSHALPHRPPVPPPRAALP